MDARVYMNIVSVTLNRHCRQMAMMTTAHTEKQYSDRDVRVCESMRATAGRGDCGGTISHDNAQKYRIGQIR